MCVYGLSLNVSNMPGNIFLNYALLASAEIIAGFIITLLIERVGRRVFLLAMAMIGGLVCLATIVPTVLGSSGQWQQVSWFIWETCESMQSAVCIRLANQPCGCLMRQKVKPWRVNISTRIRSYPPCLKASSACTLIEMISGTLFTIWVPWSWGFNGALPLFKRNIGDAKKDWMVWGFFFQLIFIDRFVCELGVSRVTMRQTAKGLVHGFFYNFDHHKKSEWLERATDFAMANYMDVRGMTAKKCSNTNGKNGQFSLRVSWLSAGVFVNNEMIGLVLAFQSCLGMIRQPCK